MSKTPPHQVIQKKYNKAKNHMLLGIWLMIIGFGVFICIAWFESNTNVLITLAVLGLLAGIMGIQVLLNGRDNKKLAERVFDEFVSANTRFKEMKKDSGSDDYKNTINETFKKDK